MRYLIVGNHQVDGVPPGGTVDLDLPAANIAALVAAGHIAKPKTKPKRGRTGSET